MNPSPAHISQLLDEAARAGAFHSLSVVRSGAEWQANLQVERGNSFRISIGPTPSAAVAGLFEPVRALSLPPLPC